MIIPIRCFTCNKVIADKWVAYTKLLEEKKESQSVMLDKQYLEKQEFPVSAESEALDSLGIKRICCRRHFLTNVDLMDKI
jgi:DNA-directed RNA polymerase I, II, and III subunit RPABC5